MLLVLFTLVSCNSEPEVIPEPVEYEPLPPPLPPPPPPPPAPDTEPFTNELLADLGYVLPPFILSGEILLKRESAKEEVSLENGTVIIQGRRSGNNLRFEDSAKGYGLRLEPNDKEILIHVAFIKSDGSQDSNTLTFSCDQQNPNGLFYLKTNKTYIGILSEVETQTVKYGGQEYSVQYGDKIPYLTVPVLRPDDIENIGSIVFPATSY
jgi:hypothetical protein